MTLFLCQFYNNRAIVFSDFFIFLYVCKDRELEKRKKVNSEVLVIKSSGIILFLLPAFYLIICPMTHQRNSEKISILNI